ncbi:MAG: hypothetical protein CVU02_00315 [Bacteroidetes bacterium HGW-Bacteroidetes-19]|nr:MAG: hypothetical protein CVU04_02070 [Bacteroidetes bacterium HGW-Bacteroidetes-20]PKP28601.1 MAG: hypothetical protein CVU02_00315 [Bacteroidetes bacterium HGW-Bacteroidetes-19]
MKLFFILFILSLYYSLSIIHSPLFIIHYSLFTLHSSLFTLHSSLFIIHYSLFLGVPPRYARGRACSGVRFAPVLRCTSLKRGSSSYLMHRVARSSSHRLRRPPHP